MGTILTFVAVMVPLVAYTIAWAAVIYADDDE